MKTYKKSIYCILAFLFGLLVASNIGCSVANKTEAKVFGKEFQFGGGAYVHDKINSFGR